MTACFRGLQRNGKSWKTVADNIKGNRTTIIPFDMIVAKKVRVTNIEEKGKWWQLHALEIVGPGMGDIDQYKPSERNYLKLKEAKKAKNGWGSAKQNRSVGGGKLKVAGELFNHGIGAHSYSEIIYNISAKGYKRFYSKVGHDDGGQNTYLTFEVYVDGEKVFDSGDMKRGDSAKVVDISVQGASELKLIVNKGRDGKPEGDHANWGNACLIK